MKNLNRSTLVHDFLGAAFCLIMALALLVMYSGCSEDNSPINGAHGGAAEEQGVYALAGRVLGVEVNSNGGSTSIESKIWEGYMVRMVELDPATFDTTENIYFSSYTDASGVFSFDSVNLKSPYVLLELSPYPNKNWWTSIDTLVELGLENLISFSERYIYRTIVNLRETEYVEMNVMTSLETIRLRSLIKQGQSFEMAKLQAGRDVMDAFGFYEEPFLFGDREYADSKASKEVLGFASVYIEMNYACLNKGEIADFGNFGTFANFADSVKTKCLEYPAAVLWSEGVHENGKWKKITDDERNMFGNFISSLYGAGQCTDEKEGDSLIITYLGPELDLKIKCESGNWLGSAFRTVREDMPRTEGTMTDPRDGKVYRTVTYEIDGGSQTWMMENLTYGDDRVVPVLDSESVDSLKAAKDYEFDVDSAYWNFYVEYKWFEALGLDSALVYTDSGDVNSEKVVAMVDSIEAADGHYRGLCPDGWRIPKVSDWNNLFKQAYRTTGYIVEDVNKNWKTGAYELPKLGFGPITTERFILRPEADNKGLLSWGFDENDVYVIQFMPNLKMDWIGASRLDGFLHGKVNVRCIKD